MSVAHDQLNLIPDDVLKSTAACLKVMSHPVRIRIVDILMQGEFPVYEISNICGMKQHQVCEHLRHMQSCGFLTSRRKGRLVYYSISSDQLPALLHCIRTTCMKPADKHQ